MISSDWGLFFQTIKIWAREETCKEIERLDRPENWEERDKIYTEYDKVFNK